MSSCNVITYVLLFIAVVMIFKLLEKYNTENFGPEVETVNIVKRSSTPIPDDKALTNFHPVDVEQPLLSSKVFGEDTNLKLKVYEPPHLISSEFKLTRPLLVQESEAPRRVVVSELPGSEGSRKVVVSELPVSEASRKVVVSELPMSKAHQEVEAFGSIGKIRRRCPVQNDDTDADTFIRQSLVSGKKLCNTISEYDNHQLANYRDTFFNFRNKIWQTSNNIDTVDKLADMYLSGNSDVARGYKGQKISDLFNTITKY